MTAQSRNGYKDEDQKSFWEPDEHALDKRFAISTNFINWAALGTANLQAQVALGRHVTLGLGGRYNPWTVNKDDFDRQLQWRERTATLDVRFWPWFVYSGWFFDIGAQYQEYNRGGLYQRLTEEGDAAGATIGVGYAKMLGKHFNIEFGIWGWGGVKNYTVYTCPRCGRREDTGVKFFLAPDNAALSILYLF